MNVPMYIPISASALSTAAELASVLCNAVRERVFVSQVSRWLSGNTCTGPLAYKQALAALRP